MDSTRVAIVDTNDLSRYGVKAILESAHTELEVLGVFSNLREFDVALAGQTVDVMLLDDTLPQTEPLGAILQTLLKHHPLLRVVVFSDKLNLNYIQTVISQGARGYVYKEDCLEKDLPHGLELVGRGSIYLSPQASALPYLSRFDQELNLEPRDLSVLQLMWKGKNVQQMSQSLMLNDRAIYRSQAKLREALGVTTNALIVAAALKQGLLREIEH
jgi:two-component system, NarL family, nitrate/nitrite response regulator NarL